MDFAFDRTVNGRTSKCLTVVDDAAHESVAVIPDHSLGGLQLTRHLDQLAMGQGLTKIIRSDNGPEFVGKAMLNWAHDRNGNLRQIDPGKLNQNAYIESFNSRLRDECQNNHWSTSLDHALGVIETWQREYNDERPKKTLGGLTPTGYAKQISRKADTLTVSVQTQPKLNPGLRRLPSIAMTPEERWVTDLCRDWTGRDSSRILALVIDSHTRDLLGWQLSRRGRRTTATFSLEQTLAV